MRLAFHRNVASATRSVQLGLVRYEIYIPLIDFSRLFRSMLPATIVQLFGFVIYDKP